MSDLETAAGKYLVWRRLRAEQVNRWRSSKILERCTVHTWVDRRLQYLVVGPELGTVREQRLVGHR